MNKIQAGLRTPYGFLGLAVFAALGALLSVQLGIILGSVVIFICFRLKPALLIFGVYIFFNWFWMHSAFVLEVRHAPKSTLYITTKGYIRDNDISAATGDLLWGKFIYTTNYSRTLPRQIKKPAGDFTLYRFFLVSDLLEARQRQSAMLLNRSGGTVRTTQAHIFAVRTYIPDKLRDEYIITGLAHLLAMSGFHVGIFTGGIFLLFFFLPRKLRAIPVILILPLLIPLSGFAVTVIRAVIFAVVYMGAWIFGLKVNNLKFLAFLAAGFILFSPFSIYSISFLLSFFAVLGILTLFRQRYTLAKGIMTVGIASTLFTLPLQLYFFGTSNIISVLTTVLFTPLVWLQMNLGLAALIWPSVMIPPLSLLERFSEWLMSYTSNFSWFFMYVAKPPAWIILFSFLISTVLVFTRYRLAAIGLLLLPLLPLYPANVLYFPQLPPSPKGYILKGPEGTEIFYQGMRSAFVYNMIPAAAELGLKTFDRGSIRIFDGENLYLKIREPGLLGQVCVNEDTGCPYVYYTRSNTLKAPLSEEVTAYIIYSNNYRDEKIIIQKETGPVKIRLKEN